MIITFTGQKGGTGKTTLATNVAGMLAAEGKRVYLVDADPQQSAWGWHVERTSTTAIVTAARCAGTSDGVRDACRSGDARRADIVIADTGGRISPGVHQAVQLADFVVIPVLPSLPDVRSTEGFYREVLGPIARQKTLRGTLVMNAMQRGVALCDEAYSYVQEQTDLPLLRAVVHQYVVFRRAIGQGMTVCEMEPKGRAAQDMKTVLAELKEEMAI